MTASGALRSLSSTVSRSRAPRSTTGTGGGGHSEKPSKDISDWAHELQERRKMGWRVMTGRGGERGSKEQDRHKKMGQNNLQRVEEGENGNALVLKIYLDSTDEVNTT